MNRIRAALAVAVLCGLAACGGDTEGRTPGDTSGAAGPGAATTLVGAGATFPFPLYSRWFNSYAQQNPVRVNYQSLGSGAGIRQFIEGTVDFGASDAPMSDEELGRVPGGALNLPTVLGSVVLTYNVPGLTEPLRLDAETISGIFLGEIQRWNDPRLASLNPGVSLPDRALLPVHRSDGSGTTFVFTDYLSAVSPEFRRFVGRGTAVRWPTGLGGKGNEGVTGQVRQTEGAIGYVEQVYARQNQLPMAAVRNRSGAFVEPSVEATTAAAAGIQDRVEQQGDFRVSIVDAPAPDAYPISSWTYLLVRQHMESCAKAASIVNVVEWAIREGDEQARALHYAPLPADVKGDVLARLGAVTCGPERLPPGAH
jgi:phosphate transport system substrate-binding protein